MRSMLKHITILVFMVFSALLLAVNTGGATVQNVNAASYPSVNRPWTADDYKQLDGLVDAGKVSLPKLSDPTSKAVFERMVSRENTAFIIARDESTAPDLRFQTVTDTIRGSTLLLTRYENEASRIPGHEREMAKLIIYNLELYGLMLELVEQRLKLSKPTEKTQNQRAKLHLSMRQLFNKVLFESAKESFFSKASRLEMIEGLRRNTPKFDTAFDFKTRFIMSNGIVAALAVTKDPEEIEALEKLNAAIKGN